MRTLLLALALSSPSPDPPPQSCFQGWCPVPSNRITIQIAGLDGFWDCKRSRRLLFCVPAGRP